MRPLSKEWQYPAIMGAVAVFFLLLFYLDYSRTVDIGNREAIGYITYKNNRVQRKFEDQVVWSNLENNSPLTNRDTIRSERLSDAVIHLNDGTVIKIDENSMFFLDLSGAAPKLSFESGAVQIQQSENSNTELIVQTAGRTINVESGSDMKIETGEGGAEDLSLIMQKGSASIYGESGTHSIGADQQARLGKSGVQVRDVNLSLKGPTNQSVQTVSGGSTQSPVQFRWNVKQQTPGLRFEVSRSRDFKSPIKSQSLAKSGPGSAQMQLPAGSYYWRLSGKNPESGQPESSEVRKLSVVANSPVKLNAPNANTEYSYVDQPPLIGFTWSRNELANKYVLEVAEDAAFSRGVRRYPVNSNSYSVSGLEAGRYFWRVRSSSVLSGVGEQTSRSGRFRIVKKEGFDVPVPGMPGRGAALAREEASEGVTFAWRAPAELDRFQVQISKDPSFTTLVVNEEVSRSYFENPVTENGTYYWRVKGMSGSKESSFSSATRFEVANAADLAARNNPNPTVTVPDDVAAPDDAGKDVAANTRTPAKPPAPTMRAQSPVNTTVNVSQQRSIGFRWKAARDALSYRFRLYRGAGGGRKLLLEKTLKKPGYTLTDYSILDVGRFSWDVEARHRPAHSGEKERVSSRFEITTNSELNKLRPEDIEFISPDTIYKE